MDGLSQPTSLTASPAVDIVNVTRRYRIGGRIRAVLDGVNLRVLPGEVVGLIGPSGSGKSTLLRHVSGLTLAENSSSRVEVFGQTVQKSGCPARNLRRVRREIGFIFQQFNLVDRLPLLTNVLIGRLGQIPRLRRWTGWFTATEVRDAMAALDRVGISVHADQRAGTLSGGQQQRAAIARVLMQRARMILADEPIASLDPESSRRVMEALCEINGIIEAMRFDQIEIAYIGGAAAVQAADRSGAEVFAQRVNAGNNVGYHTLLIVHRDSPIQSVDDLFENAGRLRAALGDVNSTSGFLVPDFYLFQRRGVVPSSAFASVTYASHEAMMLAVANQTADFATISSFQPARMTPDVVAQVREIWRSPLIPSSPMMWRGNLPEVTKNRIRAFFLSYGQVGTPEEIATAREVLGRTSGGMEIWRASSNHQLIPVRQLELAKQRGQVEQNAALNDAQKAERIAAIDAQLTDLETMVRLLAAGL